MEGMRQHECGLTVHIGQGRVRGQAQRGGGTHVSDVIASKCVLGRLPVVMRGANADGDTWQPGDRLDHADELRWAERAAELIEARGEIGDSDSCSLAVTHLGRDNRGVAHVFRLDLDAAVQNDVRESLLLPARQQPAKDRITVEARKAPPHDARGGIDKRSGAPIANHGEVQSVLGHGSLAPTPSTTRYSQARTSPGVSNEPARPGSSWPTEKPSPPNSGSTANADSSVMSSPMNIGRRPRNGAVCINSRMPLPLLKPASFTSRTDLPGSTSSMPGG